MSPTTSGQPAPAPPRVVGADWATWDHIQVLPASEEAAKRTFRVVPDLGGLGGLPTSVGGTIANTLMAYANAVEATGERRDVAMILYGGSLVLDSLAPTVLDRLHLAGVKTVRSTTSGRTDARTIVAVGPDGDIRSVELEDPGPVPPIQAADLEADLLVLGAWDLAHVSWPTITTPTDVALVLGDVDLDEAMLRQLDALQAAGWRVRWTFGSETVDPAADEEIRRRTGEGCSHIRTSGSAPVSVSCGAETWLLPVETRPVSGSALGAGDAYVGGFLAGAMRGEGPEQAHASAVREATRVLDYLGAIAEPEHSAVLDVATSVDAETDLIRHFISSTHGALVQMPAPVILSGGQTGVDQFGLVAALRYGLPAVAVMPLNRRTETGSFPLGGTLRVIEVPASSYRLRTWINALLGDVTVLFDEVGSEGSAETRVACERLGKPIIEGTGMGADALAGALYDGVRTGDWRIVNIAGPRLSGLDVPAVSRIEAALDCAVRRIGWRAGTESPSSHAAQTGDGSLRIAIPKTQGVIDIFAAFWQGTHGARVLESGKLVEITENGTELIVVRASDVPGLLALGGADAGFTWQNQVREAGLEVAPTFDTGWFGNYTGLVMPRTRRTRVGRLVSQYPAAAAAMAATSQFIDNDAAIIPIDGAAEAFVHAGLGEGAVDTWATGRTARAHGLALRDVLERSSLSLYVAEPAKPAVRSFVSTFASWVTNC